MADGGSIVLAGVDELASEMRGWSDEVAAAYRSSNLTRAQRAAQRVRMWDGRKLPLDYRKMITGLQTAADGLVKMQIEYEGRLALLPNNSIAMNSPLLIPGTSSGKLSATAPGNTFYRVIGFLVDAFTAATFRLEVLTIGGVDHVNKTQTAAPPNPGINFAPFVQDGLGRYMLNSWTGDIFLQTQPIELTVFHKGFFVGPAFCDVAVLVQASPCDQRYQGRVSTFAKRMLAARQMFGPRVTNYRRLVSNW